MKPVRKWNRFLGKFLNTFRQIRYYGSSARRNMASSSLHATHPVSRMTNPKPFPVRIRPSRADFFLPCRTARDARDALPLLPSATPGGGDSRPRTRHFGLACRRRPGPAVRDRTYPPYFVLVLRQTHQSRSSQIVVYKDLSENYFRALQWYYLRTKWRLKRVTPDP